MKEEFVKSGTEKRYKNGIGAIQNLTLIREFDLAKQGLSDLQAKMKV